MVPTKEMKEMRAFHGKAELKETLLAEIKWHEEQDKIVQGTYGNEGDEFKGCAVGCSINSLNRKLGKNFSTSDHKIYETELGIPETLAYLEDSLFERMTALDSKKFPYEFISAIPVGADLSLVAARFIVFVLNDVLQYADEVGTKAIKDTISLWADVIAGK